MRHHGFVTILRLWSTAESFAMAHPNTCCRAMEAIMSLRCSSISKSPTILRFIRTFRKIYLIQHQWCSKDTVRGRPFTGKWRLRSPNKLRCLRYLKSCFVWLKTRILRASMWPEVAWRTSLQPSVVSSTLWARERRPLWILLISLLRLMLPMPPTPATLISPASRWDHLSSMFHTRSLTEAPSMQISHLITQKMGVLDSQDLTSSLQNCFSYLRL